MGRTILKSSNSGDVQRTFISPHGVSVVVRCTKLLLNRDHKTYDLYDKDGYHVGWVPGDWICICNSEETDHVVKNP